MRATRSLVGGYNRGRTGRRNFPSSRGYNTGRAGSGRGGSGGSGGSGG